MKPEAHFKILVCIKYLESEGERVQSIAVDPERQVNPLDLIALEGGLKIKDEGGAEITALTVGSKEASKALRVCFNKGCDQGIHIHFPEIPDHDSFLVSSLITKAVQDSHFDLILFGNQGREGASGLVPIYTSELLSLPLYRNVEQFSLEEGKMTLRVVRRLQNKDKEILKCHLPCLLALVEEGMEVRLSKMDFITKASKKPIHSISLNSLGLNKNFIKENTKVRNEFLPEGRIRKKYPLLPYIHLTMFERIHYVISGGMMDDKKGRLFKGQKHLQVSSLIHYLKEIHLID